MAEPRDAKTMTLGTDLPICTSHSCQILIFLIINRHFCLFLHRYGMLWVLIRSALLIFEPRCEKTGLQGFRPGPTETRLYSYRRWLET